MTQDNKILFGLLKKEISATMMQSYKGISPDISVWKGQDITDFQEDLLGKVNGQLSEKWFYTHMKSANPSLPRIDVLNMLCKYAGYKNWNDFKFRKQDQIPIIEKLDKSKNMLIRITIMFIVVMIILLLIVRLINTQTYRFTFFDADTGDSIISENVNAYLLLVDESPVDYVSNSDGAIIIKTDQSKIRMIVSAPYYLTDTISRLLKKFRHSEHIMLRPDTYALMIHFFSQTNIEGWERRREQLNRMLSDDAMIYQIPDKRLSGMELYNKPEFIDKLTMPSSSLKQIEVLDCRYRNGQIVVLRFRIKMN